MEGLVDINMTSYNNLLENKSAYRILLYAGGLYEEYGVKILIEAFLLLDATDIQLHIYGSGELEKDMLYYMQLDNRIKYFGVVSNQIVVQKETEAILLINPRSSKEEFTNYSFPSKNMEYLVSGTPLVATSLPGIPAIYKDYMYFFTNETVEGFHLTLKSILEKSDKELHDFGYTAKQFVLANKSNYKQAERILNLAETL